MTLYSINLLAQPYTLDNKIKPIKIELSEHPKYPEAKYKEVDFTLDKGVVNYHYVKGHGVFQYVDVFIYTHKADADIKAEVVYNTWDNIQETKETTTSENGIINFKLRSYQDIGIKVSSLASENIGYSIVVNASKPIMNYLSSPFVKVAESNEDLQSNNSQSKPETIINPNTTGKISWWIYLVIGVLLLTVGLLAGKLLGGRNKLPLILLITSMGSVSDGFCQTDLDRVQARNALTEVRRGQIDAGIERINQAFSTAEATEELIKQYYSLGSCMRAGTPPGQPRIPSFCPGEESTCADCFASARAEFNRTRYNLERLQIIYDCSRSYIDAAVAWGDNVSGYHGVVGLVWQSEKRKIVRSVEDLVKAYDDKRAEMLHSFHESLLELNDCEQTHGIPDWYDRYGVMFYNFVEMKYSR